MKATLLISGMRDNRCRERVLTALEAITGVERAAVNLFRARAVVRYALPCTPPQLIDAVLRAGCDAVLTGREAVEVPRSYQGELR